MSIKMDFSSHNPKSSNALNLAARQNDVKTVRRLLKKINPNCVDNRGWTCFHEAAYRDCYESLAVILKHKRCRPMCETHEGHTALYLACRNGASLQTITLLLDRVHDIANFGSIEGVTPLHLASSLGRVELIQLLLDYGALINVQDFDGDTPLHDAALSVQYEAVVLLLHAGADVSISNESGGYTPFHLAASKGSLPIVEAILPFVTNINEPTKSRHTAFMLSVLGGNIEIIDLFLNHGANPHLKDAKGNMALDIALTHGSHEIFNKMFSITDISKINKNIIFNACKPHYFKMENLRLLLNSDLGPEYFDFQDQLICKEHPGNFVNSYIINAPLNTYLNISEYIYDSSPELFYEFFLLFLTKGVAVNAASSIECPPLVYILCCSHQKCFKSVFEILVEYGCNVDYCQKKPLSAKDCVPDAFQAALTFDPSILPIMLPYSLICDPGNLIAVACKTGISSNISSNAFRYLLDGTDNYRVLINTSYRYLRFTIPTLKQLARLQIRQAIKNGRSTVKTATEYVKIINSLPLPPLMCDYLRYIIGLKINPLFLFDVQGFI